MEYSRKGIIKSNIFCCQEHLFAMFFVFMGGLSNEVRTVLERNAARCLRCGGAADLVEYDKVLRAFFVPVWRWPGKGTAVHCNTCGLLIPADAAKVMPEDPKALENVPLTCWSCSAALSPSFRYCPQCGSPTRSM